MFRVVWADAELDRLADAFVAADLPTRQQIVSAVERANAQLTSDPMSIGESRENPRLRIAFVGRLNVLYTVDLTDRVVFVGRFSFR